MPKKRLPYYMFQCTKEIFHSLTTNEHEHIRFVPLKACLTENIGFGLVQKVACQ